MDSILSFLRTLSKNNNRDWFLKNKSRYIAAKENFEHFVAEVFDDLVLIDESLSGLDPGKLVFRIYRDVRFSKEKHPYKTNFAAAFSAAGKGLGSPGYYLHIEPGNKSFVAGGLFMPEPSRLVKVRQEIDYNSETLLKIMADRKFKRLFDGFWQDDRLKTSPKGYAKDHPHVELLKLKSFIVTHEFSDAQVKDRKFRSAVTNAFGTVKPLNLYLREAIG